MGTKHCNSDGSSMGIAKGTMLKNKPNLVIFHESMQDTAGEAGTNS